MYILSWPLIDLLYTITTRNIIGNLVYILHFKYIFLLDFHFFSEGNIYVLKRMFYLIIHVYFFLQIYNARNVISRCEHFGFPDSHKEYMFCLETSCVLKSRM